MNTTENTKIVQEMLDEIKKWDNWRPPKDFPIEIRHKLEHLEKELEMWDVPPWIIKQIQDVKHTLFPETYWPDVIGEIKNNFYARKRKVKIYYIWRMREQVGEPNEGDVMLRVFENSAGGMGERLEVFDGEKWVTVDERGYTDTSEVERYYWECSEH